MTVEPITPYAKHTERTMLDLLRRHYISDDRTPAWVFAPSIQAPGQSLRQADLICQGVTAATAGLLVGHEIKVSRADLLVELADLTKCDPWMRYCDFWYLVIPDAALLDELTIPPMWGVMTPPSGRRTRSMTIHQEPTLLRPQEQAPALRTIAAWQHWRLRDASASLAETASRLDRQNEIIRDLRMHSPVHDPRREVVAKILAGLGGYVHSDEVGEWSSRVAVDDVVAALKDLGSVYHRREEAERTIRRLRESLESARDSAEFVLSKMGEPDRKEAQ